MVGDIDRSKIATTEGQLLLLINDKMDSIKNQENRIGELELTVTRSVAVIESVNSAISDFVKTMKAMEEKLPDYFFRIQRSYIINTKYIKSFYGNTVKLSIGESLGISTNHKAELFKRLGIEGD